jgi:hypothetical protein
MPEITTRVAEGVEREPGVLGARWSTTTGSVVVDYEPRRIELPELVQLIVRLGGLCGVEVDADSGEAPIAMQGTVVREMLARANDLLGLWTKRTLDLRTAVPATMGLGSILMLLLRRRQMPAWYDLAFWSFVTFCNLNARKDVDGV